VSLPVRLHPHAAARAAERGATEAEIVAAVETGEPSPAKHGRTVNVAYIRFRERRGVVEILQLTTDFNVDVDETGAVCGAELLNANEQLVAGDDGKLLFVNDESGERGN
jgi:uncharacterized protein YuzE